MSLHLSGMLSIYNLEDDPFELITLSCLQVYIHMYMYTYVCVYVFVCMPSVAHVGECVYECVYECGCGSYSVYI